MKKIHLIISILLATQILFSQEKITKHTVQKGENITQIAIKYKTTPHNIYKLNPDSQTGIKADMILLIPNTNTQKQATTKQTTHIVETKETWFSLSKAYNTTVEELEKLNPQAKAEGLKIGNTITVPATKASTIQKTEQLVNIIPAKTTTNKTTEKPVNTKVEKQNLSTEPVVLIHTVQGGETITSISKYYNISQADLIKNNPEIKTGLKKDAKLKIINGKKQELPKTEKPTPATKPITEKPKPAEIAPKKITYVDYTILPKETLYSLSNKFGLSQAELITLNPQLTSGVQEGAVIKCPEGIILRKSEKIFTNLSKNTTSQTKKELVLLLPFNINKIESDTINSTTNRLKTDKFLNMTLDFYAGALHAIDSAKTLGISLDVKIFDSQETKSASNIANVIKQNNLQNADAVIGPFYQANAEKTAELLADSKTFVISPLSKENHKPLPNLITTNATSESTKEALFEFMNAKNGNILGIIDNKKQATKQYLSQKHKEVKLIPINDKNTFAADSLAQYFSKSKINYVILDSEKTGLILKTTASLITLQKDYQVQLVILEKNETLDFEEIPIARLAKLKMLFASVTKNNPSVEAAIFEKTYKQKNKIFPNQFATRGFDVTFDTILRLSQEKSFAETLQDAASEQVENKFDYEKNPNGGFTNKGIYILEYQNDLSVKESK
jgi:LysM repeat protein